MSSVPTAVVCGHGESAAGLVSAVGQIAGAADRFVALSNAGLGPGEIEARLREALDRTGARVVFTDLPGGSFTVAARRVQRQMDDLVVVAGVNVPALLAFIGGAGSPAECAARAAERARQAIVVVEGARVG